MRSLHFLVAFCIFSSSHAFVWLPFANLGSMFETLRNTAFNGKVDFNEPDSPYSFIEFGKEFFNGIGNFITSSFGSDEKMQLAANLREIFNLTTTETPKTTRRIRPKLIPVDRPERTTQTSLPRVFTMPYTTPHFFTTTWLPEITTTYDPKPNFRFTTTTEPTIIKFVKTTKPPSTTTYSPPELEIIRFTTTQKTKFINMPTDAPHTFMPISTTPRTTTTTASTTPSTTTTTTTTTSPTTTTEPSTTTTQKPFTRPTYQIWPTTIKPISTTTQEVLTRPTYEEYPTPPSIIRSNLWKKITPAVIPEHTHSVLWTSPMTTTTESTTTVTDPPTTTTPMPVYIPITEAAQIAVSSTAGIPFIIKARKFTRPPIVEKIAVTHPTITNKYDTCVPDQRCQIKLKSFETSDPLFQYCYSHSTMIDDTIQDLLRDTQTAALPTHISWHHSVTPEIVQLVQTLMTLYRPSRCLVIGVFTGLGLLGISERVDSRGIVVALEHPAYAVFWEKIGQKHARKLTAAQLSRIQMRTSESIEKSLPRLAANEPNTFDFVFLDDFKRENYLDDYEHSIRLLRSGGLLIINQALNEGGVMSPIDYMTNDDKVIRNMNIRIKQDSRVSASLLPYGGGTWIVSKN